jgi:hypothetical protein
MYGGHKSEAGVGSGRRRQFLDMNIVSPKRERVRKRTSRFRCVFGGTNGYGV